MVKIKISTTQMYWNFVKNATTATNIFYKMPF